jgi:hypothetical protein
VQESLLEHASTETAGQRQKVEQPKDFRRFFVMLEGGKIKLGATPPPISRRLPDGTLRERVEMALDNSSTPAFPLAQLSVSSTISLDQTLELLKHAPRLYKVDIPGTMQFDEALRRYSAETM